jgi:hypothetical protein
VKIIPHGVRTATNGDLRLHPTPGQWDPVPSLDDRSMDPEGGTVTGTLSYPDPNRHQPDRVPRS